MIASIFFMHPHPGMRVFSADLSLADRECTAHANRAQSRIAKDIKNLTGEVGCAGQAAGLFLGQLNVFCAAAQRGIHEHDDAD